MAGPSFIHLRLHTEYSIVDGIVRVEDAIKKAVADRMPALALTDLANLFGMVKFYREARAQGVKPIIGCDVWIANEAERDKPHRLLLLCQSREGYRRLCELLTQAYRAGQNRGRAEIRKSWIETEGSAGLIALSGAHYGDIGLALANGHMPAAKKLADHWAKLFPGRFYIELQRLPGTEGFVKSAIDLASERGLPAVATHPVQFAERADFKAHEARVCIAEGAMLGDQRRSKRFSDEHYFKGQAEMAELFADLPEALANSVEIAKRCNLTIELEKNYLPRFPTPGNVPHDAYLRRRAAEGLAARMEALYPDAGKRAAAEPKYQQRLDFEINTITQMGYSGYFLIVADFINWARENGVPVGPGRGSGAGSLVAYSLGITDLDPLRYDLLFERFLNPERVSMPDFDIDFCQDGRERVIEYVKQKYGADSVSQIATFGTMAARAVVRDVGRVLDLPYNFVDQLAKLIPFELGMTLKKAREQEPLLNERSAKEEEVRELLELAGRLEGIARNVSMHAGGVLIAPGKLTDYCPLYCAESGGSAVSQFDKDDVEAIGLVKFDFLGLRTLTILDWAVKFARAQAGAGESDPRFALERLPLDDKATYALFAAGNTTAVFQSESRSAKDLERRLKADCFEDLIALMALNRPGPLQSGMVDDFIARKQGRARAEYFHASLEPVLRPTYGVIVYQEQVMQIAQVLSGYSLGAADLLRRAMGKKKPEEMAQHREAFVAGAVKSGIPQVKAEHLFGLMEKFAEYGFNKSHSAAYALVAYQTAHLKAHFPAAFMAATLSADMDDTDKVRVFYEDSVANGLTILPPDINSSEYRFVPVDNKQIRYGLGAVKGTGEAAISAIVRARTEGGPYRNLTDLCRRADKRIVNRRVLESLVRAGAFDSLDDHRASVLASVGIALESAEQASRAAMQNSLFGGLDGAANDVRRVEVARWNDKERLQNEKLALGFYLSGHPFNSYRIEVAGFVRTPLKGLVPRAQTIVLAGVIQAIRTQMTRRGKMAYVTLDDGEAQVEATVFNEIFEASRDKLKEDHLVIVEGKVSQDDYSGGLRVSVEKLYDLASARNRFATELRLNVNGKANAGTLKELLAPYRPGACPVSIAYRNECATCELELGEQWRVNLDDNLLQSLSTWLRPENVKIVY